MVSHFSEVYICSERNRGLRSQGEGLRVRPLLPVAGPSPPCPGCHPDSFLPHDRQGRTQPSPLTLAAFSSLASLWNPTPCFSELEVLPVFLGNRKTAPGLLLHQYLGGHVAPSPAPPGSLGAFHAHLGRPGSALFPCPALGSPTACLLPSPGCETARRSPSRGEQEAGRGPRAPSLARLPSAGPGREVSTPARSTERGTAPNPPRRTGPRHPTSRPSAPSVSARTPRPSAPAAARASSGLARLDSALRRGQGVPTRALRPARFGVPAPSHPARRSPLGPRLGPRAPRPPRRTPTSQPRSSSPRARVLPAPSVLRAAHPGSSPPRPYLAVCALGSRQRRCQAGAAWARGVGHGNRGGLRVTSHRGAGTEAGPGGKCNGPPGRGRHTPSCCYGCITRGPPAGRVLAGVPSPQTRALTSADSL